jgi:uncharacterized protein YecT (DUF1311 family)
MRLLSYSALVPIVALSLSQTLCWAQHMNAPDAPCRTAVVTTEAAQCLDRAYKHAASELDLVYRAVQIVIAPEDRQNLDAAEQAWLKYRDATCVAERNLYKGGTGAGPAYSACLEEETRERSNDLRVTYGWMLEKAK